MWEPDLCSITSQHQSAILLRHYVNSRLCGCRQLPAAEAYNEPQLTDAVHEAIAGTLEDGEDVVQLWTQDELVELLGEVLHGCHCDHLPAFCCFGGEKSAERWIAL